MNENCKKLIDKIIAQAKELKIEFKELENNVLEASIHEQDWLFKNCDEFMAKRKNSKTNEFEDVKEDDLAILCEMLYDRVVDLRLYLANKKEDEEILLALQEAQIEVPQKESEKMPDSIPKVNIAQLEIESHFVSKFLKEAMDEVDEGGVKPLQSFKLSVSTQKTK